MDDKKYERAEHTADIALRVFGKSLEELFENSAYGMFSFILEIEQVEEKEKFSFQIKGESLEELLVSFLNYLIYLIEAEKKVFRKLEVKIKKDNLTCNLSGESLDFSKHEVFRFVKAATYHNLKIEKDDSGCYQTEIVFDV